MASRKVNEAVEQYRKTAKMRIKLEVEEAQLAFKVVTLPEEGMRDYVDMTADIDRALDIEELRSPWSSTNPASLSTRLSNALRNVGRDKAGT